MIMQTSAINDNDDVKLCWTLSQDQFSRHRRNENNDQITHSDIDKWCHIVIVIFFF